MLIKRLAVPAIIIFVVGTIYAQAFDNPLFFDSGNLNFPGDLKILDFLKWIWNLAISSTISIDRRITIQSMNLALDLNGQNLFSIVLHAVNSILLFILLQGMYRFRTAAIVSLFFAVNPAAIYAVCYLINRSQLFMVFFGILQCIFYSRALIGNKWISPVFFVLSLLCFKCAMLSKEHGIVLLVAYPILTIAVRKNSFRSLLYCLTISAFCIKALISFNLSPPPEVGNYAPIVEKSCASIGSQNLYFRSILTQAWLFFRYFLSWVFPFQTSIDMRVPFSASVFDLKWMVAFIGFLFSSIGLLLWKPTRYLGCGLLLSVCFFLPEFSIVRTGEIFVMYRSYLYSLGYMIAIGWFLDFIPVPRLAVIIFILAFGIITSERLKSFDSEVGVWTQAAKLIDLSRPEIACQGGRAFNNAGGALMKSGRVMEALGYFKKASELAPSWVAPYSNLGVAYLFIGQKLEAERVFEDLLTRDIPHDMSEQAKRFLKQIRSL